MTQLTRRGLLATGLLGVSGMIRPAIGRSWRRQETGDRPLACPSARPVNPRGRVPVALIIDDSTCLVNLAHFAIPQFATVFPDNYTQDWRALPREIPDAFVSRFAAWCHDHGVKGKYSVVPYPACVGWVDRDLPGWTPAELRASLDVIRREILPDWDIHPEMVSHTWVIDTRTGRPYAEQSDRFMENWRWTDGKSVDELADYMSYALRILKNAGLPCEGITTPGGFGNRVLPELAQASLEAVRDVHRAEIPHYFRHLFTDEQSVAPRVEYASGLDGPDPRCVVSIIGCTGDWFGGWDGLEIGSVDQFITQDGGGRLPQVIARGEPAILVCHWPGIYANGTLAGFRIFQETVRRLEDQYAGGLIWMKLSEIARYWAARELTAIARDEDDLFFDAPFACPGFTFDADLPAQRSATILFQRGPNVQQLERIQGAARLAPGQWCRRDDQTVRVCVDLPRGSSILNLAGQAVLTP